MPNIFCFVLHYTSQSFLISFISKLICYHHMGYLIDVCSQVCCKTSLFICREFKEEGKKKTKYLSYEFCFNKRAFYGWFMDFDYIQLFFNSSCFISSRISIIANRLIIILLVAFCLINSHNEHVRSWHI